MDTNAIKAIHEARTHAAEELRSLYTEAANRELSAEERQREESLATAIAEHDERIANGLKAVEAEKRSVEAFEAFPVEERQAVEQAVEVSDADALRSLMSGGGHADFEHRDQTVGSATGGGNTVPTSFYNSLVEYMSEYSTVLAGQATVIRTAGGENLQVPVATAFPSSGKEDEGAEIDESDATFGQKTLGAYKYAHMTQVSSELLADSAVDIVGFLARRGGAALGHAVGTQFIEGDGSTEPEGLLEGLTNSYSSAGGSAGDTFSYGDIVGAVHDVKRPYRNGSVFVMNDAILADLRAVVSSNDDRPLWQPSWNLGQPDTLLGYPVLTDPSMPTATTNGSTGFVYGNLREAMIVRFAGAVRVDTSTDYAFANDLVTWRFIIRADSKVVNPEAATEVTFTT